MTSQGLSAPGRLSRTLEDIEWGIKGRIKFVNAGAADPAARIARAVCVYAGVVGDDPVEGQIMLRNDPEGLGRETLDEGLSRDLADGLHSGRLIVPGINAGLLYVVGLAHALLLGAIVRRQTALMDAQQLCSLMLRGLGLPGDEAQLVAAQAANAIIRMRAFDLSVT